MKRRFILISIAMSLLFICGCGSQTDAPQAGSSADWAYSFVVWNDDIYEVLKEEIESGNIDKQIGEVKQYSDSEGMYGNGFSNAFPVGTKLFQIKDIKTDDSIALQTKEGTFIKAQDRGKYGGK